MENLADLTGLSEEHKEEIESLIERYKKQDCDNWLKARCRDSDGEGYWYDRACKELCAEIICNWSHYGEPGIAWGNRLYKYDFYKMIESLGININSVNTLIEERRNQNEQLIKNNI